MGTAWYPAAVRVKRFLPATARALAAGWAEVGAAAHFAPAIVLVLVLVLVLGANAWAAIYVSAERYVYIWDWGHYWLMFQDMGQILRTDASSVFAEIKRSVAKSDYNVVPILPFVPFEIGLGPSRLSYILAITNVGLLPSAALMALVVERSLGHLSLTRASLGAAGILGLHVLWAPALRGFPDVVGVVLACTILLMYLGESSDRYRPIKLVTIGLLLCLLVMTRRYYLFWVVSFFPSAMLAYLLTTPKASLDWRGFFVLLRMLAAIGASCGAFLFILAAPLLERIFRNDYATAYAAYRPDIVGAGTAGQVVGHFGIALLAVCAGGLAWLAVRSETRRWGVFLIAQSLLAFSSFVSVQALLGVQHYYLLVPAAGIGLAASIAALWNSKLRLGWRAAGVGAVFAVVLLSSAAVFGPSHRPSGPLLPSARYVPLVRSDLAELQRLLAAVAALKPGRVYVAASSEVLNWTVLKFGCRETHRDLCGRILVTPEIDTRDGFPKAILKARYVLVATPTQYHVRPDDQRIVGLVVRDIREGRGIGSSFAPLPGVFDLSQGVKVQIYRRVAPLRNEDVKALGAELAGNYPRLKGLFATPGA